MRAACSPVPLLLVAALAVTNSGCLTYSMMDEPHHKPWVYAALTGTEVGLSALFALDNSEGGPPGPYAERLGLYTLSFVGFDAIVAGIGWLVSQSDG